MPDTNLLAELNDALEHGAAERCGVITADGQVIEIQNIHENPVVGFHMEPGAFIQAVEAGAIATWHTHPGRDPNLSQEDFEGFHAWPNLVHHIIGIRDGEPAVHSFRFEDGALVTA